MYKCVKCQKKYFKKYNFCPKCGNVVEQHKREKRLWKKREIKYLVLEIIAVIALMVIFSKAISVPISNDGKISETNELKGMVTERKEVTKQEIYDDAMKAYNEGEYDKAILLFDSVNDIFEDAKYYKSICRYYVALDLIEAGEYYEAQQQLDKVISRSLEKIDVLEGQDIDTLSTVCCPKIVEMGLQAFEEGNYLKAYDYLKYTSRKPQYVKVTDFEEENRLLEKWNTIRGNWVPTDSVSSDYIEITDNQIIVSSSKLHSGTYDYVLKNVMDYNKILGYQSRDCLLTKDGIIRLQLTDYSRSDSSEFEDTQNGNKIEMYLEGSSYLETQEKIQEYKAAQEKKEPQIGMTQEQVEASTWGTPYKINKTTYRWGVWEQWCYSNYRYIYFENGYVTIISE